MAHDFTAFPELTNNQMRFYYWDSPHKQITMSFEGKVEKVNDGDTITMSWAERDFLFPVRLADINAPELNKDGGLESKIFLQDMLEGEEVRVEIDQGNRVGKWGRLIGRIRFWGMDIGQESIRRGFAKPFR